MRPRSAPSRVAPGKVLAYDAFAGTLIATKRTGRNIAVQPRRAADTHRLHSRFGRSAAGNVHRARRVVVVVRRVLIRQPGDSAARTGRDFARRRHRGRQWNPEPAALRRRRNRSTSRRPLESPARHRRTSTLLPAQRALSDSRTLPIVASNPTAFLNTTTPVTGARDLRHRGLRIGQRTAAACLQPGWLAQHVSESCRRRAR